MSTALRMSQLMKLQTRPEMGGDVQGILHIMVSKNTKYINQVEKLCGKREKEGRPSKVDLGKS